MKKTFVSLLLAGAASAAMAASSFAPVTIADQGTFMAGGTVRTTPGEYVPMNPTSAGQTIHGDHAAVRYQIPVNARKFPVVMLHGFGQSSRTWETTADGREGFATMMLRDGYGVYLLDQPRRGQAGRSSVSHEISATTDDYFWYGQFRIGLYPNRFAGSQFVKGAEAEDQFFRTITPDTGKYDAAVITDAVAKAIDKAGPSIFITHSAGGGLGWVTATKTDNIRAIVSYEPGSGFIFPKSEAPEPVANSGFWGAFKPAIVSDEDFKKLTRFPIVIYYGDNIPKEPSAQKHQDYWRAAVKMARIWADTVNRHGGNVTVVELPDIGIKGNTHFPMSDLNNKEVLKVLEKWLDDNHLSDRN